MIARTSNPCHPLTTALTGLKPCAEVHLGKGPHANVGGAQLLAIAMLTGFTFVCAAQDTATNATPTAPLQAPQPSSAPAISPGHHGQLQAWPIESAKLVVDFQKSLTEAAKNHEDFLEKLSDRYQTLIAWTGGVLTAMVGVAATLLTLFGFRSFREIQSAITKRINAKANEEIATARERVQQGVSDFESKVANVSSQIWEVAQKQDQQQRELDKHARIKRRLDQANFAILTPPSDRSYKAHLVQAVVGAEKAIAEDETHAAASSVKGMALIRLDRTEDAINELQRCLNAREAAKISGGKEDKETGNLYYNLACYQNMLAEKRVKMNRLEEAENLRAEAWENLKRDVCNLNPEDLESAKVDGQLETIISATRKWSMLEATRSASATSGSTP